MSADGFINIGTCVDLYVFNLIFTLPVTNNMSYFLSTSLEGTSRSDHSTGNIFVQDCIFDYTNAVDNIGLFGISMSDVAFSSCEFKTSSSFTDCYIFDLISTSYPYASEANWKFIDCITPTIASEAYEGIFKSTSGKVSGFITIAGNSTFTTSITDSTSIRVIQHV